MLHLARPGGASKSTYSWEVLTYHRVMRAWVWTYRVRIHPGGYDGYHYATLHFRDREAPYSEDRLPSLVDAMDFCHRHADERRGWTNTQKAAELRRVAPLFLRERIDAAAVAQGLARQKHNRVVYRKWCTPEMVDLEGKGVRLG